MQQCTLWIDALKWCISCTLLQPIEVEPADSCLFREQRAAFSPAVHGGNPSPLLNPCEKRNVLIGLGVHLAFSGRGPA